MCEGKMHRVQPDLEHQCPAKNPQVRICVPTVRGEENKAEEDSNPKKIGKNMEKREVEELLGAEIPDSLFQKALGYAERKQRYIYNQNRNPVVMQHWYLVKLTGEYANSLAFTRLTMDMCRTLHDMEKEHSAKSQSALTDIHIVTCPA